MRRLRMIGIGLAAGLFLVVLGIHVYAQVFRWRAEHLLAQLKTLRLEETSAATALKLRSEYSHHVIGDGPCSEEHCAFLIELTEWEWLWRAYTYRSWSERPTYYLVNGLRFFGLRINDFTVSLRIESGRLRSISVWLSPMSYIARASYVEGGFLSNFFIRAETVGNFSRRVGHPQIYEHPNLYVGKPSACTGCSGAIYADFTWQASREEYERALGFDLSCITRFHDCRTPEEFLPTAAQVLKEDEEKKLGEMVGKIPCDTRTASILGRDSDFIQVVRIKKVSTNDEKLTIADYDLVKVLKGKTLNLRDLYYTKQFVDAVEAANSGHLSQRLLQIGTERIVYFNEILKQPTPWSDCAMMAATPQNLSATIEGIAEDRSGVLARE
jgi:hypothetical protein